MLLNLQLARTEQAPPGQREIASRFPTLHSDALQRVKTDSGSHDVFPLMGIQFHLVRVALNENPFQYLQYQRTSAPFRDPRLPDHAIACHISCTKLPSDLRSSS